MKIIVVGTGYVGLVSGACLADVGMEVYCIDIDAKKIEGLKNGEIPIYEPGLDSIVHRNIERGRLHFSTSLKDCIPDADAAFIAVGTPPREDGSADLKYVTQVAKEIGEAMNDYLVVVTKSTVPVGTSKLIKETITEALANREAELTFDVASNPEFLKEGAAIQDFMSPDRVIVGVENDRAKKVLERLYKPFQLNGYRIIYMDITSAELTKYAANSMLATRISFMNDIANLCELVGANVNAVRHGIGSDPRIGSKFLYPGVGYGGSCFPKDVKALVNTAKSLGHELQILQAVEDVNQRQKMVLANKVIAHYNGNVEGKTFSLWGMSFKPNTDDMREASSITIVNELVNHGAKIKAYDPVAMEEAREIIGDKIEYCHGVYETVVGSDGILLVTEWNEFRSPDWERIKQDMNTPVIFDGRNIFDKERLEKEGFSYLGIGL